MNLLIRPSDYQICLKHLPIVTVDLIIFNHAKDQVLLFKRKNEPLKGVFYSPGGRVMKNETVEQAIQRKAQEELGIEISFKDMIPGWVMDEIFENSIYPGINAHCINIFFGYIAHNPFKWVLDEQHEEGRWFKTEDPALQPYLKKKIEILMPKL